MGGKHSKSQATLKFRSHLSVKFQECKEKILKTIKSANSSKLTNDLKKTNEPYCWHGEYFSGITNISIKVQTSYDIYLR